MTNQQILDFIESHKPCKEGKEWLLNVLKEKPEITPEELWNECLNIQGENPKTKKLEHARYWFVSDSHMTSVGRAFAAWFCRQLQMPCSTGIYSGREKINVGPPVGQISFETIATLFALETEKVTK